MIEETEDYWIYQDYLIFKPTYNKKLNNKLLSKYNRIIFSNYTKPLVAIETNNELNYSDFYSGSIFGKYCFSSYLLNNIFNKYFNCVVLNLPPTLTHLTFGDKFNKLVSLPENLINLTFGDDFDEDYEYFDVEELTDDEQQLNDVEILNELEDKYETEEIDEYGDIKDRDIKDIKVRKIKDSYRQTNNILTKYEKARVLGIRSLQLSLNFKPMIKTDISDTYEISKIELKNKILPLK
jgi:DNA-directed RNA polymerase subunit K/omega